MNMVMYVSAKNLRLLLTLASTHNNGIHATKTSKVNGETGHEAQRRTPLAAARRMLLNFFK